MKETITQFLTSPFVTQHLLPALGILLGAIIGGYLLKKLVDRMLRRVKHIDITVRKLLVATTGWGIYVIGIIAALNAFGVNTAGLLTAMGAIGLGVGLALRDALSNVAAGLLIVFNHPIAVGEFVAFGTSPGSGISGKITNIGPFSSTLQTFDGIYVSVPNKLIWEQPITNYDRNPIRRVNITVRISYGDSIETGLKVMLDTAHADKRTLPDQPYQVFVDALADSSVNLSLRVWTDKANYWDVRRDLTKSCKLALEAAGLSIPFPQRDVHVIQS